MPLRAYKRGRSIAYRFQQHIDDRFKIGDGFQHIQAGLGFGVGHEFSSGLRRG
jgi:hypothetical protein